MINIAISLGIMLILVFVPKFALSVSYWLTIPFGLLAGVAVFFVLARKVQEQMMLIMNQVQRDMAEQKPDRAIETLKRGFVLKNRQILVAANLHSQIGTIYYVKGKKFYDQAMEHLEKGFIKNYVAQGMLAAIHYHRKEYDKMAKAMDDNIKGNAKEPFLYALYAWFLIQTKDKDGAMAKLQAGVSKLPNDERLKTNLTQLQNGKKLKMKPFGDVWIQFQLERAPRVMQQQGGPPHMRMSRKAMFR